ncbi:molybdopterin-dependent oxidoreductase [Roseomonas sp. OT10]|uniref:molybdopterin-dependent oxidoreductase n=1 Tax=Roseomonas cutis TaxID=2897332 RepID=UPI001E59D6A1|nr:molybdopterin-dependent oxidoreductase [Roseomonas sp. OT10]UFN46916.1 molybdopterin-dependent oxidoreductase [Roseomonas sp. OT10]
MRRPRLAAAWLGALLCLAALPAAAQAPAPAGRTEATGGVAVGREGGPAVVLDPATLSALPAAQARLPAGHGAAPRHAEGPLLWTVLVAAGAVDPAAVHEQVRQTVTLLGRDGYTAVLALGEVSPEFANRPVLLALRLDGEALAPGALRLVVPDEVRGGRSVRDLARITVSAPATR